LAKKTHLYRYTNALVPMAGAAMLLGHASIVAYNQLINYRWWRGYYGLGTHAGLRYRDTGAGTPFAWM